MATSGKFIPGSDVAAEDIFTYPFFIEEESKEFIKSHGKIMFIIRGPPGTGKGSLANLTKHHFTTSVECSADDYFNKTFNKPLRTRDSLRESHFYCHRRVKQECIKNTHPVVVSNTHMKKKEMQEYLNLAAEYEYTVIIVSTLDKFEVSPDILARSNTKGLDINYFKKRLQAWQDVFPLLMGWFVSTDDSFYILLQLQSALNVLLGDGKFCRVFNAFDKDTLLNIYKAKTVLCCIAGFMKNSPFELRDYYKDPEVRDSYGKCFTIPIHAFVITESHIFAIVPLDNDLKKLTLDSNFENNSNSEGSDYMDRIINTMQSISLRGSYNFKLVSLNYDFSRKPKSASLSDNSADHLNINESSFVHLAQQEDKSFSACELNELFRKSLSEVIDQNGKINVDQFNELEGGYLICRLCDKGWIIKLPQIISVKTVFTGLYI